MDHLKAKGISQKGGELSGEKILVATGDRIAMKNSRRRCKRMGSEAEIVDTKEGLIDIIRTGAHDVILFDGDFGGLKKEVMAKAICEARSNGIIPKAIPIVAMESGTTYEYMVWKLQRALGMSQD